MTSFDITADWQLEPGAFEWVRDNHVRPQFDLACKIVNRVLRKRAVPQIPKNAWDAFAGRLEVFLHPSYFVPGGAGYWGSEWPQGWQNPAVSIWVECAWDRQYKGDTIIQHELVHVLSYIMGIKEYNAMGHGGPDDPLISEVLKPALDDIYSTNSEKPSDVRLRHVTNLGVDL